MNIAILVVLSLLSPVPRPAKLPAAARVWTNPDVEALETTASLSINRTSRNSAAGGARFKFR